MRYAAQKAPKKLAQFATDVFDVPACLGEEQQVALEGVARLESFFRALSIPTNLREAGITNCDYVALAARALPNADATTGEYIRMRREDMVAIYRLAE